MTRQQSTVNAEQNHLMWVAAAADSQRISELSIDFLKWYRRANQSCTRGDYKDPRAHIKPQEAGRQKGAPVVAHQAAPTGLEDWCL